MGVGPLLQEARVEVVHGVGCEPVDALLAEEAAAAPLHYVGQVTQGAAAATHNDSLTERTQQHPSILAIISKSSSYKYGDTRQPIHFIVQQLLCTY